MPVHVRIPTPLRRFAGDRAAVPLEAETLGNLMDALFEECPDLKPHLVGEDAKIRNFVNIFVNGEDARHRGGLLTSLRDGDKVAIVPAIAGGVELTGDEILRYSRHLILPEVTIDGQRKLRNGSVLPLASLPKRLEELERDDTYVIHCRSGARSAEAVDVLTQAGFSDVHNLRGGILAWAQQIDPQMPVY